MTIHNILGKIFTHSQYLKQHMLVHTGDKPYHCGSCGKHFYQASILKTHMLIHTKSAS